MKLRLLVTLILSLWITLGQTSLQAQDLISSEYLSSISETSLESTYGVDFLNGVDLYRILYTTPDVYGALDTASGLFIVPDDAGFIYPMLIYQHGTVDSRWDVPSQLQGGYQLATAFGGSGFATIAPDFVGLGEARGLHPYVHADTEASAAIDMLFAAKEFANQNDFLQVNEQLFISGYSQGGHAAMAAHRSIELDYANELTVTAAAPMSGPYSISKKMVEFTLGDTPYGFVAYIAWTTLSYNMAYGNLFEELEEIFKPNYAVYIGQFASESITLGQLNAALTAELIDDVGTVTPKDMLQDSMLNIIFNEPDHPVSMALADNDLHDWTPTAPTRILYCTADDQVYYQNATYTDSIMNANGATDVVSIDMDPTADHGGCVVPATSFAILFFSSFQNVGVATQELTGAADDPFVVAPNPLVDELVVKAISQNSVNAEVQLYDVNGKLVSSRRWTGTDLLRMNIEQLNSGLYFLMVDTVEGRYSRKVVVGK